MKWLLTVAAAVTLGCGLAGCEEEPAVPEPDTTGGGVASPGSGDGEVTGDYYPQETGDGATSGQEAGSAAESGGQAELPAAVEEEPAGTLPESQE